MKTYIVLLRGINVSGKNKLPMQSLKAILNKLGYKNVQTYIQSGNVVLQSDEPKHAVSSKISQYIKTDFGYNVPVLVKTADEWNDLLIKNPFKNEPEKQQYFTFLSETPSKQKIEVNNTEDCFKVIGDVIYVNAIGGYGKTKLHNIFFEKVLQLTATTRNLKTSLQLQQLANTTQI